MVRAWVWAGVVVALATPAVAADRIEIVGSSTVFPFTARVIEEFARQSDGTVVGRSTGTGGGLKAFCAGAGDADPDIAGASRPIASAELDLCAANGVDKVIELMIGRDGIVVAQSNVANTNNRKNDMPSLTRAQIYQALASETVIDGTISINVLTSWRDISAELPPRAIRVMGPPKTSGTRDAFEALALDAGCSTFRAVDTLDAARRKKVCHTMRTDGPYIEMGEDDNEIIRKLREDHTLLGIFGYSYAESNPDIEPVAIEGILPSPESIADGTYPLARPLFLYVKASSLDRKPQLREFLTLYLSDVMIGDHGALVDVGLVPPTDAERASSRRILADQLPMGRT